MDLARPPKPAAGVRQEVLDDHLRVLGDGVLVGEGVPGEQAVGLRGVHLALVLILVHQLPVRVVRDVVPQRVEDEAFLDGLMHGVGVEGAVGRLAVHGVFRAEEFEGLRLRGGGECEVGEIRGPGTLRGLLLQLLVDGDSACAWSSESASRPRSRRAALTAVEASPDWEECASSMTMAKFVPLISVGLRSM